MISKLLTALLKIPIKCYQIGISPFIGNRCRYFPSCSTYAIEALDTHGAVFGSFLAAKRICRCHPWATGGYDPVPERPSLSQDDIE
ncbi:MAG: membrane protein insertion efficiency factor YidD [Gammaproteobacteria bacterium]|nr:membrane protein insertion efficiency factor YidD [Gammaproteobacteria bacterium]